MDGNGRWAQKRHLPRASGHEAGLNNVIPTLETLGHRQVKYVTLYGFSTENWNRPPEEVQGLFQLLERRIDKEANDLHKRGAKILHIGQPHGLSENIKRLLQRSVELTKDNTGIVVCFAFNYGGRAEIIDAVRRVVNEGVPADQLDEKSFANYLYTAGLPDVDLLIRTGGELRTSNFLIWQAAYSEFYFSDVLWPDFNTEEMEQALASYGQRHRRFGGLKP